MNSRLLTIGAIILVFWAQLACADTTVIHAGQLLAVPGESPLARQSIIIKDDRIVEIRDGFIDIGERGVDATLIDLSDKFVLPGLMDMHVHLQIEIGPELDSDSLKMSNQLLQMRSVRNAKKTLLAGFTTVRDAGSLPQEMYALRDAIELGWVDGPRIVAAGVVGITGGHSDVSGMKPELLELTTDVNVCDGPYDCRRATRNSIKYGADLIKIAATGGVMSDNSSGVAQQMEADELEEVVRAARRMGKTVAAHAHHESGVIAALEAGVASIEHATYAGPSSYKLFKETGAYLVPTLSAGKVVEDMARSSDLLPEAVRSKALRVGADMIENFRRSYTSGVRIAYGTDAALLKHGANAEEASIMVQAGMTEMEVIVSATINSADLLGMSDSIGTIEKGKYADIIAVQASPLNNISELLNVSFVMKSGRVYKR